MDFKRSVLVVFSKIYTASVYSVLFFNVLTRLAMSIHVVNTMVSLLTRKSYHILTKKNFNGSHVEAF